MPGNVRSVVSFDGQVRSGRRQRPHEGDAIMQHSIRWPQARGLRSALALALAATLGAGCATNLGPSLSTAAIEPGAAKPAAPTEAKSQGVKIAMLLPLGGYDQAAVVAKAMKQAGEMALFELDNPAVQLIVKDDKGSAEGARAAADEAIKDGAEIILGPLFSKAVSGAASAARPANVPVLAFSNDQMAAGNGVYLMSFLAEAEVDRVVTFAASHGKKRFAALIPDDPYGRVVEPAFRMAVARAGGSVVALQTYPVTANGMLEPARKVFEVIKGAEDGAPIDALFLPGGQEVLPQIGPLIAYSGIDTQKIKLIGTGAWDFPNIGRDDAFVGGWYPGPDPMGWRSFSERFAKTFGSAPPRIASLAYDAVTLAVTLASNPQGARYTAANLTRPSGFNGADGPVRFNARGLAERGLAVLEVQKFGAVVADPAPSQLGAQPAPAAQAPGAPGAGPQGLGAQVSAGPARVE